MSFVDASRAQKSEQSDPQEQLPEQRLNSQDSINSSGTPNS